MRLMHLQVKKWQNGRIKVFRDKQATSKVPLIFSNIKILKKNATTLFLETVNEQEKYSACI